MVKVRSACAAVVLTNPLLVALVCAVLALVLLSPAPVLEAQPNPAKVNLVAPYRVTVGAAAVQLTSSGNVHGVVVKAMCPGQTIYIGVSSAVTTATGYPMTDAETLTLEVRNANQIYAIASAPAQAVAVLPFTRY